MNLRFEVLFHFNFESFSYLILFLTPVFLQTLRRYIHLLTLHLLIKFFLQLTFHFLLGSLIFDQIITFQLFTLFLNDLFEIFLETFSDLVDLFLLE